VERGEAASLSFFYVLLVESRIYAEDGSLKGLVMIITFDQRLYYIDQ
jgi:hypothetical protein